jgi:hypothetical protein
VPGTGLTKHKPRVYDCSITEWGSFMPITPFLDNGRFDPEATRIMGVAFEWFGWPSGLRTRGDLANEVVARRIIELAKTGERNPDLLCERALKEIRARRV